MHKTSTISGSYKLAFVGHSAGEIDLGPSEVSLTGGPYEVLVKVNSNTDLNTVSVKIYQRIEEFVEKYIEGLLEEGELDEDEIEKEASYILKNLADRMDEITELVKSKKGTDGAWIVIEEDTESIIVFVSDAMII